MSIKKLIVFVCVTFLFIFFKCGEDFLLVWFVCFSSEFLKYIFKKYNFLLSIKYSDQHIDDMLQIKAIIISISEDICMSFNVFPHHRSLSVIIALTCSASVSLLFHYFLAALRNLKYYRRWYFFVECQKLKLFPETNIKKYFILLNYLDFCCTSSTKIHAQ